MQAVRKVVDVLVYSNFFIGVCALALTFTNQLTIGNEIHFDTSCWFIFFSTVFTYSVLKIKNPEGTESSTTHRSWASQNVQLAKNILLISAIATVVFFFRLERNVQFVVIGLAGLTAFYGFVQIPFARRKMKLRDLGMVKTIFVAIVWSVTTVIVPLEQDVISTDMMVFLLLRRFLFILALTMVFEIKDMQGDRQNNLKTLPLSIGVSNTKLLAQGILLTLIVINLIQYFFFGIALSNMLAVNLSLLVSIILIQPVKEETRDNWYYIVLDGMMILQFSFVYAAAKLFA